LEDEMKITIENTTKIVELNGVPARIWEGHTDTGIPVHCFVTRIGVSREANVDAFEIELKEQRAPSAAVESYPLRLVL
jgi:hypothetical protein